MNAEMIRMIERLFVVASGTASLYFGYSLFLRGIVLDQTGNIEIPKTLKINAAKFAPGIFFAAFGSVILITSLVKGIATSASWATSQSVQEVCAGNSMPNSHPMARTSSFSGIGPQTGADFSNLLTEMNRLYALWHECDQTTDDNENRERLAGAFSQLRAHLLFLALPELQSEVATFLRATGLRKPLATVANGEELERLEGIEAVYLSGTDISRTGDE